MADGGPGAFIRNGHPEAFANTYLNVGRTIAAHEVAEMPAPQGLDYPGVQDGAGGVHFILTALESGRRREWINGSHMPPA